MLFVYGTLMSPDVFANANGEFPRYFHAILKGWKRVRIEGASFPGIKPSKDSEVRGFGVPNLVNMGRIDRYEGVNVLKESSLYIRDRAEILLCDREWNIVPPPNKVTAHVYIPNKSVLNLLDEDWNAEEFLKERHGDGWIKTLEGYFDN